LFFFIQQACRLPDQNICLLANMEKQNSLQAVSSSNPYLSLKDFFRFTEGPRKAIHRSAKIFSLKFFSQTIHPVYNPSIHSQNVAIDMLDYQESDYEYYSDSDYSIEDIDQIEDYEFYDPSENELDNKVETPTKREGLKGLKSATAVRPFLFFEKGEAKLAENPMAIKKVNKTSKISQSAENFLSTKNKDLNIVPYRREILPLPSIPIAQQIDRIFEEAAKGEHGGLPDTQTQKSNELLSKVILSEMTKVSEANLNISPKENATSLENMTQKTKNERRVLQLSVQNSQQLIPEESLTEKPKNSITFFKFKSRSIEKMKSVNLFTTQYITPVLNRGLKNVRKKFIRKGLYLSYGLSSRHTDIPINTNWTLPVELNVPSHLLPQKDLYIPKVLKDPNVRKQIMKLKKHKPYFIYTVGIVNILCFILTLIFSYTNTGVVFSMNPLNPMLGPDSLVLIRMGARFLPCIRPNMTVIGTNKTYTDIVTTCPVGVNPSIFMPNRTITNGIVHNTTLPFCNIQDICGMGGFSIPNQYCASYLIQMV
jgi:hypothetical protein